MFFYSSKGLQKALEKLREREKYVIESIYGLNEGKTPATLENVGKELGITGKGVFPIKQRALRKLRKLARDRENKIILEIEDDEYLTDKERQLIEEIKRNIQLQNGNLSENLEKLKEFQEKSETRTRKKEQEKRQQELNEKSQKKQPKSENKAEDENQRIIENNEGQRKEDIEKSKLIQRLLEQQQTIDAQQKEINRLRKLLGMPQQ